MRVKTPILILLLVTAAFLVIAQNDGDVAGVGPCMQIERAGQMVYGCAEDLACGEIDPWGRICHCEPAAMTCSLLNYSLAKHTGAECVNGETFSECPAEPLTARITEHLAYRVEDKTVELYDARNPQNPESLGTNTVEEEVVGAVQLGRSALVLATRGGLAPFNPGTDPSDRTGDRPIVLSKQSAVEVDGKVERIVALDDETFLTYHDEGQDANDVVRVWNLTREDPATVEELDEYELADDFDTQQWRGVLRTDDARYLLARMTEEESSFSYDATKMVNAGEPLKLTSEYNAMVIAPGVAVEVSPQVTNGRHRVLLDPQVGEGDKLTFDRVIEDDGLQFVSKAWRASDGRLLLLEEDGQVWSVAEGGAEPSLIDEIDIPEDAHPFAVDDLIFIPEQDHYRVAGLLDEQSEAFEEVSIIPLAPFEVGLVVDTIEDGVAVTLPLQESCPSHGSEVLVELVDKGLGSVTFLPEVEKQRKGCTFYAKREDGKEIATSGEVVVRAQAIVDGRRGEVWAGKLEIRKNAAGFVLVERELVDLKLQPADHLFLVEKERETQGSTGEAVTGCFDCDKLNDCHRAGGICVANTYYEQHRVSFTAIASTACSNVQQACIEPDLETDSCGAKDQEPCAWGCDNGLSPCVREDLPPHRVAEHVCRERCTPPEGDMVVSSAIRGGSGAYRSVQSSEAGGQEADADSETGVATSEGSIVYIEGNEIEILSGLGLTRRKSRGTELSIDDIRLTTEGDPTDVTSKAGETIPFKAELSGIAPQQNLTIYVAVIPEGSNKTVAAKEVVAADEVSSLIVYTADLKVNDPGTYQVFVHIRQGDKYAQRQWWESVPGKLIIQDEGVKPPAPEAPPATVRVNESLYDAAKAFLEEYKDSDVPPIAMDEFHTYLQRYDALFGEGEYTADNLAALEGEVEPNPAQLRKAQQRYLEYQHYRAVLEEYEVYLEKVLAIYDALLESNGDFRRAAYDVGAVTVHDLPLNEQPTFFKWLFGSDQQGKTQEPYKRLAEHYAVKQLELQRVKRAEAEVRGIPTLLLMSYDDVPGRLRNQLSLDLGEDHDNFSLLKFERLKSDSGFAVLNDIAADASRMESICGGASDAADDVNNLCRQALSLKYDYDWLGQALTEGELITRYLLFTTSDNGVEFSPASACHLQLREFRHPTSVSKSGLLRGYEDRNYCTGGRLANFIFNDQKSTLGNTRTLELLAAMMADEEHPFLCKEQNEGRGVYKSLPEQMLGLGKFIECNPTSDTPLELPSNTLEESVAPDVITLENEAVEKIESRLEQGSETPQQTSSEAGGGVEYDVPDDSVSLPIIDIRGIFNYAACMDELELLRKNMSGDPLLRDQLENKEQQCESLKPQEPTTVSFDTPNESVILETGNDCNPSIYKEGDKPVLYNIPSHCELLVVKDVRGSIDRLLKALRKADLVSNWYRLDATDEMDERSIEKLVAHINARSKKKDAVVLLMGDVLDHDDADERTDDTYDIIRIINRLHKEGNYQVVALMGRHEAARLDRSVSLADAVPSGSSRGRQQWDLIIYWDEGELWYEKEFFKGFDDFKSELETFLDDAAHLAMIEEDGEPPLYRLFTYAARPQQQDLLRRNPVFESFTEDPDYSSHVNDLAAGLLELAEEEDVAIVQQIVAHGNSDAGGGQWEVGKPFVVWGVVEFPEEREWLHGSSTVANDEVNLLLGLLDTRLPNRTVKCPLLLPGC